MRKLAIAFFALTISAPAFAAFGGGDNNSIDINRNGNGGNWGNYEYVTCESQHNKPAFCPVQGPIQDVRMVNQRSNSPCIAGQTWNYDQRGIYVWAGCRADFEVDMGWNGGGGGGNYPPNYEDVRCGSNGNPVLCRTMYEPYQMRALRTNRYCIPNRTFGLDRRGVWTDRGCVGIFRVFYR